ncbi:CUB domain-containing protein 2-like [Littorina saxatilis]|uniref:CUB domain-containing protein 2-like n=1 Tax=Littorina saxatilis TaxID=31220 RepID=UPI0038B539E7
MDFINTHCEWVLTAPEGETVVLKVIKSEMEGDCSDIVRVYDGKEKSLEGSLGRWCANEAPQYASTGRHLLVIFTADDRWNTGGFEAHFSIDDAGISTGSVWAIVGGLLAAVIIIVLVVIIVVLYMRHWRTEQRKI